MLSDSEEGSPLKECLSSQWLLYVPSTILSVSMDANLNIKYYDHKTNNIFLSDAHPWVISKRKNSSGCIFYHD